MTIPSCPLRTANDSEKIKSARIEMRTANVENLSVHCHHADTEQVVGGDAVFQAVRAAGVHGDVAGDGAGELA